MNACEPLVRRQVRGDKKSTWLVKSGEVAALINQLQRCCWPGELCPLCPGNSIEQIKYHSSLPPNFHASLFNSFQRGVGIALHRICMPSNLFCNICGCTQSGRKSKARSCKNRKLHSCFGTRGLAKGYKFRGSLLDANKTQQIYTSWMWIIMLLGGILRSEKQSERI